MTGWQAGRQVGIQTFVGEQNFLCVVGQAQPGGSLGVWQVLHPLNKLLSPEEKGD